MTACPKCRFEGEGTGECARCGVVYARWRAPAMEGSRTPFPFMAEAQAPPVVVMERNEPGEPRIDRLGWAAFGGGLVAALIALQFPLAEAALSGMKILVHEMGHAAFGWLFGYPSIPVFDFSYGGGVTLQHGRSALLAALVILAMAAAASFASPRSRSTERSPAAVARWPRNARSTPCWVGSSCSGMVCSRGDCEPARSIASCMRPRRAAATGWISRGSPRNSSAFRSQALRLGFSRFASCRPRSPLRCSGCAVTDARAEARQTARAARAWAGPLSKRASSGRRSKPHEGTSRHPRCLHTPRRAR